MKINSQINTFQYNAFAETVIENHKSYEDWFNNNYIQIVGYDRDEANSDYPIMGLDYLSGSIYGHFPLMQLDDLSPKMASFSKEDIVRIIDNGLERGDKWYLFLDHFYIPDSRYYQKKHFIHDVLVYTTQEENWLFLESRDGRYDSYSLTKNEMTDNIIQNKAQCLYNLSLNSEAEYIFNIDNFLIMLKDYLYSRNSLEHKEIYLDDNCFYSEEFYDAKERSYEYFGIESYELIKKIISEAISKQKMIDYRMIYLMKEHNKNMISRLDYCIKNKYIDPGMKEILKDKFTEVDEKIGKLLNRSLRYNLNRKKDYMGDYDGKIDDIVDCEKKVIADFIEGIESYLRRV